MNHLDLLLRPSKPDYPAPYPRWCWPAVNSCVVENPDLYNSLTSRMKQFTFLTSWCCEKRSRLLE